MAVEARRIAYRFDPDALRELANADLGLSLRFVPNAPGGATFLEARRVGP